MPVLSRLFVLGATASALVRASRIDEEEAWPTARGADADDVDDLSDSSDSLTLDSVSADPLTVKASPPVKEAEDDEPELPCEMGDSDDLGSGEDVVEGFKKKTEKVDAALAKWRNRPIDAVPGTEATAAAADEADHDANQVEDESKTYGKKVNLAMEKANKLSKEAEAAKSEFFKQADEARDAEAKAREAETEAAKQKCIMDQRAKELKAAKVAADKQAMAAKKADALAVDFTLNADKAEKAANKEVYDLACKKLVAGATAPYDGTIQPEVNPENGTEAPRSFRKGEVLKIGGVFCPDSFPKTEEQFDSIRDRLDALNDATHWPNPAYSEKDADVEALPAKTGCDEIKEEADEAIADLRKPSESHVLLQHKSAKLQKASAHVTLQSVRAGGP